MSEPASASKPLTAYLRGVGLWTPGFASFADWAAAWAETGAETGEGPSLALAEGQAGGRPAAELLHPRLRRRTSVLTRASVTALEAAVREGGADLASVRFVLVSSFGEIETTVELLAQLADPQGPVSPTKFHNSVHNTATGYMSIANGNHREATALAGGPHNLEIAMLEVLTGLAIDGGDAVLLVGEELLPEPFARADGDPTFALALLLSAEPARARHPSSRDLRVTLEPVPSDAEASDGPFDALPTMLGPVTALLQAIAGFSAPGESGTPAGTEPVRLDARPDARPDPGVACRWQLRLSEA